MPIGSGWILDNQNKLSIEWISENLVTDAALVPLSCHCPCSCTPEPSSCLLNELRAQVCADLRIATNKQI